MGMLEEQSDKLAQLIANDFIELEVTEGGEPIDMTGEDLMDIISSIASMTFDMVYIKESQITPSPTLPPTESPTEAPTEVPTESPTEAPTEAPTESPTVSEAVVESNIVTKATEKVKEDMLEEQADKLAQLIANDFIELEVTEGGEPIDMTGEDLMDIISSIASMTFDMVYIKESQITPSPTLPPTLAPTESPTYSPTESPTDSPTSSPTIPDSVVQSIVKKAVEAVSSYVEKEGPINMPELDTDKVSSLAENVLNDFRDEVGEENVTEDMLEEQADKLAQLIANDYLELEIAEGGEPVDLTEEELMDIVSTITDVTFQIFYDAEGNR